MASTFKRKNKLWARVKNEHGKWTGEPTPFAVGQEAEAEEYTRELQGDLDRKRAELAGVLPIVTVAVYAAPWLDGREKRGVRSVGDDRGRINNHVLPVIGHLRLDEVTPTIVRDLVRALRSNPALAPRTVRNIYGVMRTMFDDAATEGKILISPCKLKRKELPKKRDKNPEWRDLATYSMREVRQLLTSSDVRHVRRVEYALKALAGLRHGEAAGLCWRHYNASLDPLGRLVIACSYDHETKTEVTRRVPVHPELAQILATWRAAWSTIYGRAPRADDYVIPTLKLGMRDASESGKLFKRDLIKLGMRDADAEGRERGGHDLRSWFITTAQEHGAHRDLLRVVTHRTAGDVVDGYTRASWPALCAEVLKLRFSLACDTLATPSVNGGKVTRNMATPTGFESVVSTPTVRDGTAKSASSEIREEPNAPTEPQSVASLATPLARAVLDGDHERARVLAERIMAMSLPRAVQAA